MSRHVQVSASWHPRASSSGCVYKHILVAEAALGKALPNGAHVHHVDGNPRNNSNRNLVICQDVAYHKLLHYRADIVRRGGDPNKEKWCRDCSAILPLDSFNKSASHRSSGRQSVCRSCQKVRFASFANKRKAAS